MRWVAFLDFLNLPGLRCNEKKLTTVTAPDLDGGGRGAQAWWEAPQNL